LTSFISLDKLETLI